MFVMSSAALDEWSLPEHHTLQHTLQHTPTTHTTTHTATRTSSPEQTRQQPVASLPLPRAFVPLTSTPSLPLAVPLTSMATTSERALLHMHQPSPAHAAPRSLCDTPRTSHATTSPPHNTQLQLQLQQQQLVLSPLQIIDANSETVDHPSIPRTQRELPLRQQEQGSSGSVSVCVSARVCVSNPPPCMVS